MYIFEAMTYAQLASIIIFALSALSVLLFTLLWRHTGNDAWANKAIFALILLATSVGFGVFVDIEIAKVHVMLREAAFSSR